MGGSLSFIFIEKIKAGLQWVLLYYLAHFGRNLGGDCVASSGTC